MASAAHPKRRPVDGIRRVQRRRAVYGSYVHEAHGEHFLAGGHPSHDGDVLTLAVGRGARCLLLENVLARVGCLRRGSTLTVLSESIESEGLTALTLAVT